MRITVRVTNAYPELDEEYTHLVTTTIAPPFTDSLDDWAQEELFPLTGEAPEYSRVTAYYEVTVLDCADAGLVGRTFEFGI